MKRKRFQQERQKRGMSFKDVAKAVDLTERAIRFIEDGKRDPSWGTAQKLSNLFGIPSDELLVQDFTPKSDKTESA